MIHQSTWHKATLGSIAGFVIDNLDKYAIAFRRPKVPNIPQARTQTQTPPPFSQ